MFCHHCQQTIDGDEIRHILEHTNTFLEAIMLTLTNLVDAVANLNTRVTALQAGIPDPAVEAEHQAQIDDLTNQINGMAPTPAE